MEEQFIDVEIAGGGRRCERSGDGDRSGHCRVDTRVAGGVEHGVGQTRVEGFGALGREATPSILVSRLIVAGLDLGKSMLPDAVTVPRPKSMCASEIFALCPVMLSTAEAETL